MNSHTICDTPESIRVYRLLAIKMGLKLEIKTGMRHSRNMVLNAARYETGKKTRVACLAEIEKILDTLQA